MEIRNGFEIAEYKVIFYILFCKETPKKGGFRAVLILPVGI